MSGAGFLYVGIRARRLNWSIAGVVYSLLSISAGIWGSSVPPEALASYLAFTLALIVWLASIVHALVINNQWLRWRAGYQPWYAQQPAAPWAGAPAPAPLPPEVQGLVPPPQQYYGTQPPANAAPPPPAPREPLGVTTAVPPTPPSVPMNVDSATVAPTPPDVPLDVNSATLEQLAELPGVGPERAAQAVSSRDSRGGFVSLTEFAAAASLAPHEFVAVRGRLTCAPPPVTPQQDHDQPFGRIVDV
ncbi:hypothetical protein FHR83_002015 [Actinoplanes campanulatus]|uniref:Helix-hairpin-helix motif-containing protein n=1 Tax=Actinoplanes campanulatus TaxID=113559 RepID=A0A7W5ADK5_9ACTN|nr:helix-hairpin-helix domain-containing protein [Actinoplanes campanulatus]MBB3094363.1 hypothetical protein [Actinoplanes campanulatus]GGN20526.1 hypothetical protein GCM10010109_34300 [Actinoplanes campanulatus]GID35720.1 hypothetical protein Aca09nite_22260 [Actinoplanes campanulatus]